MKTYLFTFVFTFCLMLPFMVVAQKHLHNGFVAATNNGVYYLQDGFNEWVQLTTEETKSISFDNSSLLYNRSFFSTTYKESINKLYGYAIKENITGDYYGFSSEIKNIQNGLISNDKIEFYSSVDDYGANYYVRTFGENFTSSYLGTGDITGIAVDSDSIFVIAGINNTLKKLTVDIVGQTVPIENITGLTSNAASGHQICYDSNNDLFWIVSDEGFIYSYNKTTVAKVDTIENVGELTCDSITDVSYNQDKSDLIIGTVLSDGNRHVLFIDSDFNQTWWTYNSTNLINIITATNAVGSSIFNYNDVIINYETSSVFDTIASLPVGTVIYDLDYIDYLPYEPVWDYEGVMTVGNDGGTVGYSNYLSFGSLNPSFSVATYQDLVWYLSEFGNILALRLLNEFGQSVLTTDDVLVKIGNTEYTLTSELYGITGHGIAISNPFPSIGEPCTIKLKYTLQ